MTKLVLAAAGLGIVAEVLRRGLARRAEEVPAQVSAAAAAQLGTMRISPCSDARGSPRDYTELYILQKQSLGAKFGTMTEANCGSLGFSPCIPIPTKTIPTASIDCTLQVMADWTRVARELERSGSFGLLTEDLRRLANALDLLAIKVRSIRDAPGVDGSWVLLADTNRRVWSAIGRLAIVLQGVLIHHGDPEAAGAAELKETLTNPASYVGVAADGAGVLLTGVAHVAGEGVGRLLSSNLGAILVVGGAGYLALRSS